MPNSMVSASTGVWYRFVFVHSGNNFIWYVNGAQTNSQAIGGTVNSVTNNVLFGKRNGGSQKFNGLIANIQIYNASLSASEVRGLYVEGIGGAPALIQNLVGWWPLNGDVKDCNGNNGVPTAVTYSGSRSGGYALR